MWQWQVLRLPHSLRTGPILEKNAWEWCWNRKKIGCQSQTAFGYPARRPGNQNDFWRALVLAHPPVQKICMTLHDAEAQTFIFFHLRPHWVEPKKSRFTS